MRALAGTGGGRMVWQSADGRSTKRGPRTSAKSVAALMLVSAVCASYAAPLSAESLQQALTSTYRTNPQLDAARATLRATDEDVARANASIAR